MQYNTMQYISYILDMQQVYLWYISSKSEVYLRYILVYLRYITDISKAYLKLIQRITQGYLRYIFWVYEKYISGISQIDKILGIPQSYLSHISGTYQVYLKYISDISKAYPRNIFSHKSQEDHQELQIEQNRMSPLRNTCMKNDSNKSVPTIYVVKTYLKQNYIK